eukprot:Sdes_comp20727_c0_seq3m16525
MKKRKLALEKVKKPSTKIESALSVVPAKPNQLSQSKNTGFQNSLMFYPAGIPLSVHELLELNGGKTIQHNNTRFNTQPVDSTRIEAQRNVIGPLPSSSSTHPYLDTPTPVPGEGYDASPMMTWGTIDGTPFRLDGFDELETTCGLAADVEKKTFKIPQIPKRDLIAHRLTDTVNKQKKSKGSSISSPLVAGFGNMSPAARHLLAKTTRKSAHEPTSVGASHDWSPLPDSHRAASLRKPSRN